MTGKVHAILGASTAVAVAICCWPTIDFLDVSIYPAIGVITSTAGSYFPDIDISQSRLGKKHKWLSAHLKHRGITHTLLGPSILTALMLVLMYIHIPLLPSLLFGFVLGWLAHIVADLFNKKGVPLFWPLFTGKVHLACIKTASMAQQVVFIVIWEVFLLLWISMHYGLLDKVMGML